MPDKDIVGQQALVLTQGLDPMIDKAQKAERTMTNDILDFTI